MITHIHIQQWGAESMRDIGGTRRKSSLCVMVCDVCDDVCVWVCVCVRVELSVVGC